MIAEKSFTIQGQVEKILPVEMTKTGARVGKFFIKTVSYGKDGTEYPAHFEIRCLDKSIQYVYEAIQEGQEVKVTGNISSHVNTSNDGRKWMNYSLIADRVVVDTNFRFPAATEPEKPVEQPVEEKPEYTIDSDDLPF